MLQRARASEELRALLREGQSAPGSLGKNCVSLGAALTALFLLIECKAFVNAILPPGLCVASAAAVYIFA